MPATITGITFIFRLQMATAAEANQSLLAATELLFDMEQTANVPQALLFKAVNTLQKAAKLNWQEQDPEEDAEDGPEKMRPASTSRRGFR